MKNKNDVSVVNSGISIFALLTQRRSFLKLWRFIGLPMVGAFALLSGIAGSQTLNAAINVYFSASAPPALQAALIAGVTTQYNAQVTASPYFANTYTVTVSSINPAGACGATTTIIEPAQIDQDVNNIVAVTTATGVYMFASGMTYQQDQEEDLIGAMGNLCGSATDYHLVQTSTSTFNSDTCQDVVGTLEDQLFNQSLSTPTVIPPEDAL